MIVLLSVKRKGHGNDPFDWGNLLHARDEKNLEFTKKKRYLAGVREIGRKGSIMPSPRIHFRNRNIVKRPIRKKPSLSKSSSERRRKRGTDGRRKTNRGRVEVPCQAREKSNCSKETFPIVAGVGQRQGGRI